jgi:hypothetical protein
VPNHLAIGDVVGAAFSAAVIYGFFWLLAYIVERDRRGVRRP